MSATVLVTPAALEGVELLVEGDAYHHLFRAARSASGDAVRVVDGQGRARQGVVTRVDRRTAWVRLGAEASAHEPRLRLELLVAAPRPSRLSWLVEKGTELGVRAFRFLDCERSERPVDGAALDRLRRVAAAAVEQCGRSFLPELSASHRLEAELARRPGTAAFLLDPGAQAGPIRIEPPFDVPAVLLVGPEGGFTAGELAAAARFGARATRLGPATLRVETAALAGVAWLLLQAEA